MAPERFGNYLVYERLGAGGMATVHRAVLTGASGFERPVALKRLLPHLAHDDSFVRAFVREARIAAQLRHANVAQTYDLGLVGESYYIAMELIEGHDLRQVLRQAAGASGPMPPALVVNLLAQVCDALEYAHGLTDETGQPLGIVHRDVSPANIIVGRDGTAKLIDFGIARATSSSLMTMSGQLKGKFAYIAPETMAGTFDARADLFSLGVVAHELLTAQPLLSGNDEIDTLRRVREHEIPPPSAVVPGIPEEVDAIVMTSLTRDPAERWQSAAAMRGALGVVASRPHLRAVPADVARWIDWAFSAFEVRPSARRRAVTDPAPRRDAGGRRGDDTDADAGLAGPEPDSSEVSMVVEPPAAHDATTDDGVAALPAAAPAQVSRTDLQAETFGAAPAGANTLEMMMARDAPRERTTAPMRAPRSSGPRPVAAPIRPAALAASVDETGDSAATLQMRPARADRGATDDFDVKSTNRVAQFASGLEAMPTTELPRYEGRNEPVTLVDVAETNIIAEISTASGEKPTLLLSDARRAPAGATVTVRGRASSAPPMTAPHPAVDGGSGRVSGPAPEPRSGRVSTPATTARTHAVPPPTGVPPLAAGPLGSSPPPGRPGPSSAPPYRPMMQGDPSTHPTMIASGTPHVHDAAVPPASVAPAPVAPPAAPAGVVALGAEYKAAAATYAASIMTPPPGSLHAVSPAQLAARASAQMGAQRAAPAVGSGPVAAAASAELAAQAAPRRRVLPLVFLCLVLAAGVAVAGYFA